MPKKWKQLQELLESKGDAEETSPCWLWVHAKSLGHVWLFATPWMVACQAPLSMGFPRQEYWSGLPFHSPRGSCQPKGSNPGLLHWQADSFSSEPLGKPNLYERSSFLSYHRDGRIKAQKIGISQFIIHGRESALNLVTDLKSWRSLALTLSHFIFVKQVKYIPMREII